MTIEIANRLVKLRKEKGLSQEELADKLGLSRQAVSKWERAEASPDTDNLICLAKLYGVSLDELLNSEDDIETIVKEQVEKEENKSKDPSDDETIVINKKEMEEFAEHCCKKQPMKPGCKVAGILEGILFTFAIIAFLILGCLVPETWAWNWIIFFIPEIICSIIRAISKKEFTEFNWVFLVIFTYFFVCMALPITFVPDMPSVWHPTWVIFMTIPAYYIGADALDKYVIKSKKAD